MIVKRRLLCHHDGEYSLHWALRRQPYTTCMLDYATPAGWAVMLQTKGVTVLNEQLEAKCKEPAC